MISIYTSVFVPKNTHNICNKGAYNWRFFNGNHSSLNPTEDTVANFFK